jgi:hypothetical protein
MIMLNFKHILRATIVLVIATILTSLLSACGTVADVRVNDTENSPGSNSLSPSSNSRKPQGNEVDVRLTRNGPRSATIVVTNVSSIDVFLPYLPGIRNQTAAFVILGLEKKNPANGEFERAEETHFGPGSNSLSPGDSFFYKFSVASSGKYRVSIRYLIDKEWSERTNAMSFLDHDERIEEAKEFNLQIENLVGTVTAGPIDL